MIKLKKYLPLLLLATLSLAAWFWGLPAYFDIATLKTHQHTLELFVQQQPFLSLLGYAGLYILIVSLSIPGATLMTLAGGFLFGQFVGMTATVISATLGASILFLSAKMASQAALAQRTGKWINKLQKGFQGNAFSYMLTLRLIPLFPFFVINLVAAFLAVRFRSFFWGTLIGIIPGTFIYTSMGVALHTLSKQSDLTPKLILEPKILMALVGLGILALIPVLYKKWKK